MSGRVVVIAQVPPPVHGSTAMASRLLEALTSLSREYVLVDKRFSARVEDVGRFSLRKVLAAPNLWWRLLSELRRRPSAVVLFVTDRPGSFLVDLVSTALVGAYRVPLIHQVHSHGFSSLAGRNRAWYAAVAWVLGRATIVTCASEGLANDLRPFVAEDRLAFIPNTVGDPVVIERNYEPPFEVLFLANLYPSKRPHLVIDVLEGLSARGIRARATIAGAPSDAVYQRQLSEKIDSSPLRESISIIGPVDEESRLRLLSAAHVLLLPTEQDAQPLVILEALSTGLPVVSTAVGGIPDLLRDGAVGRAVDPDDISAMVGATYEVLTNPGEGERRRAVYAAVHGSEVFAANWERLLSGTEDRWAQDRRSS